MQDLITEREERVLIDEYANLQYLKRFLIAEKDKADKRQQEISKLLGK
jgi:DNA-directed RNA polymerase subunit F